MATVTAETVDRWQLTLTSDHTELVPEFPIEERQALARLALLEVHNVRERRLFFALLRKMNYRAEREL